MWTWVPCPRRVNSSCGKACVDFCKAKNFVTWCWSPQAAPLSEHIELFWRPLAPSCEHVWHNWTLKTRWKDCQL
eukprot:symbB.v1.2.015529.t1/scaffold1161.1/size184519/4